MGSAGARRAGSNLPNAGATWLTVAAGLDEAGERLFTLTRLDPSQWTSARTTDTIERLSAEFRRHLDTRTVPTCAETVPTLPRAPLASGRIILSAGHAPRPGRRRNRPLDLLGARRHRAPTAFATRPAQRPRKSPPRTPRITARPVWVPSWRAKLLAKTSPTESDRDDRRTGRDGFSPERTPE